MAGAVRHLYVHLPFCRSRCAYCDFASEPVGPHARSGRLAAYLTGLRAEFEARQTVLAPGLETVYVGGGSPTALPPDELVGVVRWLAPRLEAGGEFTVEADPGGIDERLLARLAEEGATRLSLGVQSFSPALRGALGRRVAQEDLEESLRVVRASGLASWNLDLVFAIPGQDPDSLAEDLRRAIEAEPDHVSFYDLTYTERYERYVEARRGCGARAAAEEFGETAYAGAVDALEAAGYERYEVSNFAREGHRSRHNSAYWRGEDYLGLGASAVSTVGLRRWTNPVSVEAYLRGDEPAEESLTPGLRRAERVMLALRTAEGVSEVEAGPVLDHEAWRRAEDRGLAKSACGRLFLTRRGLDLSNLLLAEVLVFPDDRAPLAEV